MTNLSPTVLWRDSNNRTGTCPEYASLYSVFREIHSFNRFELQRLREGEKLEVREDSFCRLLFVLKGSIAFDISKTQEFIFSENEGYLLPCGITRRLTCLKDGLMVILVFDRIPDICERRYKHSLSPYLSSCNYPQRGIVLPPVAVNALLSIVRYIEDDLLTHELSYINSRNFLFYYCTMSYRRNWRNYFILY